MTLPSLIKKHEEIVTVNKVKKVYSILNQAFLMARKDNGDADVWFYADAAGSSGGGGTKAASTAFASYFKPYLRIIKDCGTEVQCLAPGKMKFLNGNEFDHGDYNTREHYKFILDDGTYIWMRNHFAIVHAIMEQIKMFVHNYCLILTEKINLTNWVLIFLRLI